LALGIILLLEQGHYLATNCSKRGPLYYTCGLTLLVLIVVSNAYKGDNIQSLTKLLQTIPYIKFTEIVNGGMKLLSPMIVQDPSMFAYRYFNITEFEENLEDFGWQLPFKTNDEIKSALQFHPLARNITFKYKKINTSISTLWTSVMKLRCLDGKRIFYSQFTISCTKKITRREGFLRDRDLLQEEIWVETGQVDG